MPDFFAARANRPLLFNQWAVSTKRIESGESLPRSFTLKAIADALGIPFETLTTEEIKQELPAAPMKKLGIKKEYIQ